MRLIYFLLFFMIVSCAQPKQITKPVKTQDPVVAEFVSLTRNFINECETDLLKSSQVIGQDRLISSLSHLNFMDKGGRRYYLLEKENITTMMRRLASHPYSECLLIDRNGKIVYTMNQGEPLGKKISYYRETPLYDIFYKAVKGESVITDVVFAPQLVRSYNMFFSHPVVDDSGAFQGVVVSAVAIGQLAKKLPDSSKIINSHGRYSYHSHESLILGRDDLSERLVQLYSGTEFHRVREIDGIYVYQPVKYKNIEWIVAIRESSPLVLK
ncbi:MAG: hypothetical protein PF637_05290 [Spirochaetes bacterium]|jgi:hypothetical protein|nr:hypothetical protein [Spirochaetota bacterium]